MNELEVGLIKDDSVAIGSANSYISSFKKNEEIKINSIQRIVDEVAKKSVPDIWDESTEKEILTYYYIKLGNKTGEDFDVVAPKIVNVANRVYKKDFTLNSIVSKLESLISIDEIKVAEPLKISHNTKREKFKVIIKERKYDYIKDAPRLSNEQLELTQFLDNELLCFSSDENGVYLTVKVGNEKSFDDLFNFSPKEMLVYEMFKDQLNDDFKSKKLVLMSRMLAEEERPKKRIKK